MNIRKQAPRKLLLFLILLLTVAVCLNAATAAETKGSNIWDEDQRMPSTYNWTPYIYSGFYYDADTNLYTESLEMSITTSNRSIDSSNARYTTEVEPARFAYADWGSYNFIAWLGDPYFAGYDRYNSSDRNDTAYFANSNVSALSEKKLFEVLINEKSERKISSGDTLSLENGYRIRISDVNNSSQEFRISLEKDGSAVKNETVSRNSTFVYEKNLDNIGTTPIIAVHVKEVSDGKAVIDGLFQISEKSTDVSLNKRVDAMEITSVNNTTIVMKNPSRIDLSANRNVTLMDHIKIKVGDSSKLRFELVSDPKTDAEKKYPSRSTVYDRNDNNIKSWTGRSYDGFTYVWSDGSTPENLTIDISGSIGRTINPKEISYEILSYNSTFNYSDWGGFRSVSIAGDEYFAGYTAYSSSNRNNTTNFTSSDYNILEKGQISKVLVNNNSSRSYGTGSEISLENGYSLKLNKIEGENSSKTLNMSLMRNGSVVENVSVSENQNYMYKRTIGDVSNVPVIVVRIGSIFVGSSSTEISIPGIFQISENATNVTAGQRIDNMRVEYTSKNGFYLLNNDTIDLSRGRDIKLVNNLSIHVADSDTVRFFFFNQNGTSNNTSKSLKFVLPDSIFPYQEFDIKVLAADGSSWINAEGAQVKVNGNSIGNTDSSGTIRYTPGDSGTYEFSAEKSGYSTITTSKSTTDPEKTLTMTAPDYIFAGDTFVIFVRDDTNMYISGASVYQNDALVGTSDDNGSVSVTAPAAGYYAYKATKPGYAQGTMEKQILAYGPYFAVTNASLSELSFGFNQRTKIPFEVTNVGKEKGTQNVSITYNGQTTTKKVTLDVNETKTVSYTVKPETVGYNVITVDNQSFAFYVNEDGKGSGLTLFPDSISWKTVGLIGGLILLIILIAAGIWYYMKNKDQDKSKGKKSPSKSKPSSKTTSSKSSSKPASKAAAKPAAKPAPKPASKPKENTHKYSSSNKPAELKNSQKKARAAEEKKGKT
ncbi:hypothetical protein MsAg5_06990 [Methanosarcinaceae archaeon Ag5]|uniref:S-layer family duplication domain-containing protein n=1 Tax=Methanolapillus africanus TaxID=3028297 RepID=A0AAE4MJ83_9EURY|nr:hypothetical protein [Methanosarcinaceae archaeon Ag5]